MINFFTVNVPDMMSLGELLVSQAECTFGTKNKGKLICNSPNDIISGNFDNEKVDQDGTFYYKDTSLRITQILHIQKIISVVHRTLNAWLSLFHSMLTLSEQW